MTGWHVHVHALLDVRGDVDEDRARGWLVEQWLEVGGGSSRGQHVKAVERGDTGCAVELCKYVAKPLSQAMAPEVGRELFHALHSRRLLEGMGRWRGWRKIVDHDNASLLIGPSVGGLLARMHGQGPNPVRNPIAIFEGYIAGEKWTVQTSAADAWELVSTGRPHASVPAEVRARGLSPPEWERDPFLWSRCRLGPWDSSTNSSRPWSSGPKKSSSPSSMTSPSESGPAS